MAGAQAPLLHELLHAAPAETSARMSDTLYRRWPALLGTDTLSRRLDWGYEGPDPADAPPWEDMLAAALSAPDAAALPGSLDPIGPIPFEEALLPFVVAARAGLEREAGTALGICSPAARAALERHLFALLSVVATPVLGSAFSLQRALAGSLPWLPPRGRQNYEAFVASLQAGGLRLLLADYPALARLLATVARGWVLAHGRLLQRLERDWHRIVATFGFPAADCQLDGITAGCSDPHDGGQSVTVLHLSNGRRLVYKPRSLEMEIGLAQLLDWAGRTGFPWPFRAVALLPGEGYGWMEFVEAAPCDDEAAVGRFHARSGGLFCLWWLLQGTDVHHENLIASGEYPVIVDAETLLHPRPFPGVIHQLGPGAGYGASPEDDFARALLESGFLATGKALDLSAWGQAGDGATPFQVASCQAINSDAMTMAHETFHVAPRPNQPVLHGQPRQAAAHAGAIVDGFTAMSRLVVQHRHDFLTLLDGFAGCSGRFVARATNTYGLLLHAGLQPEWLREGPARGVLFERLRQAALAAPARPACWPLLDAELAALERLDIPRLSCRCDLPAPCWPAPLVQARARVAGASLPDLDRHAAALRQALTPQTVSPRHPHPA